MTMNDHPTGYRVWQDLGFDEDWSPGLNTASCLKAPKKHKVTDDLSYPARIPVETCGCGYWYYRDFSQFVAGVGSNSPAAPGPRSGSRGVGGVGLYGFSPADSVGGITVVGFIQGGGKVIEGELGFRAAKARIIELYDETDDPAIAAVAERFEVLVKPYPWPTVTGWVELQDRPGLPSVVKVWSGEETQTFYVSPSQEAYAEFSVHSFVTVKYRRVPVGQRAWVPVLIHVEAAS